MNPIAQEAVGSIIRWALAFLAGFLVQHGIWTSSNAEQYVAAAAVAIIALAWSLWQKYKSRITLLTALTMPVGTTESEVVAHVNDGLPTPPVTTAADAIPVRSMAPGNS